MAIYSIARSSHHHDLCGSPLHLIMDGVKLANVRPMLNDNTWKKLSQPSTLLIQTDKANELSFLLGPTSDAPSYNIMNAQFFVTLSLWPLLLNSVFIVCFLHYLLGFSWYRFFRRNRSFLNGFMCQCQITCQPFMFFIKLERSKSRLNISFQKSFQWTTEIITNSYSMGIPRNVCYSVVIGTFICAILLNTYSMRWREMLFAAVARLCCGTATTNCRGVASSIWKWSFAVGTRLALWCSQSRIDVATS